MVLFKPVADAPYGLLKIEDENGHPKISGLPG